MISRSVESLARALQTISAVLPDISQFSVTEDIERGVWIPGIAIYNALFVLLMFGLPLMVLAYVIFRNKEVAAVTRTRHSHEPVRPQPRKSRRTTSSALRTSRADRHRRGDGRSRSWSPASCATGRCGSASLRRRRCRWWRGIESRRRRGRRWGRWIRVRLALLPVGVRGPLVMFLWSTSESQKADKNLEDFDTKVEWIRLLQPEFDTVHIFQIWNKAYNILRADGQPVQQVHDDPRRDVEYARSVGAGRPDNINIIVEMAKVYSDKLDNSAEKNYYKARVRSETMAHTPKQRLKRDDPPGDPSSWMPSSDARATCCRALSLRRAARHRVMRRSMMALNSST